MEVFLHNNWHRYNAVIVVLYYVIPGLLKMKRRYRILLQMDKLKKAMKDKKANHTKNVKNMMSSVCHTYLLDDSP